MITKLIINGTEVPTQGPINLEPMKPVDIQVELDGGTGNGTVNAWLWGDHMDRLSNTADWKAPYVVTIQALPAGVYTLKLEHWQKGVTPSPAIKITVNVEPAPVTASGFEKWLCASNSLRLDQPIYYNNKERVLSDILHGGNIVGFRRWHSCNGQVRASRSAKDFTDAINDAKEGFKTIYTLAQGGWGSKPVLPTAKESAACARQIIECSADAGIEYYFIGNEPNHPVDPNVYGDEYWPGNDAKKFVDCYLNPMYEEFHKAGFKCGGVSATGSTAFLAAAIKNGAMADIWGAHPYKGNDRELRVHLTDLTKVTKGADVFLDEFNTHAVAGHIRYAFDPHHKKSLSPVWATEAVLDIQVPYLKVPREFKNIKGAAYFIMESGGSANHDWEHTNGPLCAIEKVSGGMPFVTPYGAAWLNT